MTVLTMWTVELKLFKTLSLPYKPRLVMVNYRYHLTLKARRDPSCLAFHPSSHFATYTINTAISNYNWLTQGNWNSLRWCSCHVAASDWHFPPFLTITTFCCAILLVLFCDSFLHRSNALKLQQINSFSTVHHFTLCYSFTGIPHTFS